MRDDSGATLVDTLASVSLISLAVVGVLGALGAAVAGASAEDELVSAEAVLVSYGESLRSAALYVPCAAPEAYAPSALGFSVPGGYTARVSSVEVWDGTALPAGFAPVPGGCDALSDPGVQRLTLEVAAVEGSAPPRTVSVVWRHP